jgi:phosphopantetheinyl transferase (holo-ACP synthase)
VGVDVSQFRRRDEDLRTFFRHMRDYFSPDEWRRVEDGSLAHTAEGVGERAGEGVGEELQLRAFEWMWVLKESYLKAVGIGLCAGLSTIDIAPPTAEDGAWSVRLDGLPAPGWTFHTLLLDADHPVALALAPFSCSIDHPAPTSPAAPEEEVGEMREIARATFAHPAELLREAERCIGEMEGRGGVSCVGVEG